jgi:hypothetical protein
MRPNRVYTAAVVGSIPAGPTDITADRPRTLWLSTLLPAFSRREPSHPSRRALRQPS